MSAGLWRTRGPPATPSQGRRAIDKIGELPRRASLMYARLRIRPLVAVVEFEKKILLLGDPAVGKTSLVRRFVIDRFSDRYIITIGTKTSRKLMEFQFPDQDLRVKLQLYIWDVFGQQGMPRAYSIYFKGADAAILVCDLTRPFTVAALETWGSTLRSLCGPTPCVVACNKVDLVAENAATQEEIAAAGKFNGTTPLKTSAKTGENVDEAFRVIGSMLCAPLVERFVRGDLASQKVAGRKGKPKWKPLS